MPRPNTTPTTGHAPLLSNSCQTELVTDLLHINKRGQSKQLLPRPSSGCFTAAALLKVQCGIFGVSIDRYAIQYTGQNYVLRGVKTLHNDAVCFYCLRMNYFYVHIPRVLSNGIPHFASTKAPDGQTSLFV